MKKLLAVLLVAAVCAAGCNDRKPKEPSKDATPPAPGATGPSGTAAGEAKGPSVTAQQLFEDYTRNAAAADEKYKGKVLRVTGKVLTVKEDKGQQFLYLALPQGTLGAIKCRFKDKPNAEAGKQVVVEGKCEGKAVLDVALTDCTLVESK